MGEIRLSWNHINGIMLDIEGLSKLPDALIISIGACRFNIDTGVIDREFKVNLKIEDGKKLGLRIEKSTVQWWKSQPKEILQGALVDAKSYEEALTELENYILAIKPNMIWAWGTHYDVAAIINALIKLHGEEHEPPWHYQKISDARTIKNVFLVDNKRTDATLHDSLSDAKDQAQYLIDFFKGLENGD